MMTTSRLGVDHLDDVVVLRPDEARLRRRFTRESRPDLAESVIIIGIDAEGGLDTGARGGVLRARLSAERTDFEWDIAGLHAAFA